ncbi:hypothetical protein MNBD_CHLOROFLEXI01-1954 [hydrothermal vent metagenome]|uniref:Uncharacterized protein n=1 Tax=hydrothermal vent metagenome TaxID=652676 RepID=A0A3B0V9D6_9ZZZZ
MVCLTGFFIKDYADLTDFYLRNLRNL